MIVSPMRRRINPFIPSDNSVVQWQLMRLVKFQGGTIIDDVGQKSLTNVVIQMNYAELLLRRKQSPKIKVSFGPSMDIRANH